MWLQRKKRLIHSYINQLFWIEMHPFFLTEIIDHKYLFVTVWRGTTINCNNCINISTCLNIHTNINHFPKFKLTIYCQSIILNRKYEITSKIESSHRDQSQSCPISPGLSSHMVWFLHRLSQIMITKRGDKRTDCDTAKTNITTPLDDMPNLSRSPSNSLPISKQPIPLSSIYYILFETIENHHVPNYTIPLYQQISKFSPQTPRNKRKIFLGKCFIQIWLSLIIVTKLRAFDMLFILISLEGLDTIKDQVSDTPEFDKSCLTALSSKINLCYLLLYITSNLYIFYIHCNLL